MQGQLVLTHLVSLGLVSNREIYIYSPVSVDASAGTGSGQALILQQQVRDSGTSQWVVQQS